MINRFNQIHKYVILLIIYTTKINTRVLLITFWINIANHLLELHNYFSLMAVYSALDSIQISKLRIAWLRINKKHIGSFKNLSTICDARGNFKAMRKLMRKTFISKISTIPYIGVFLSDLTFVNEGANKQINGLFNFKKFERFAERCQILQRLQQNDYKKIIKKNNKLIQFITNDIKIFDKLDDKNIKILVNQAVSLDMANATNNEKELIKLNINKFHQQQNGNKKVNKKSNSGLFRRFNKK